MALVYPPRLRVYSDTEETDDFVISGRAFGSMSFAEALSAGLMSVGDTADYFASYGDAFEEGTGRINPDGELERGYVDDDGIWSADRVWQSRHANGTIDQNKVSFAAGRKTIIVTLGMRHVAELPDLITGALRFDKALSLTTGQKAQLQTNISSLPAPAGTIMPFQQTTAPVGWTKSTTHNDKALRVVSGTPGSGGSLDFSTVFAKTAVDNLTLLESHLPSISRITTGGSVTGTSSQRIGSGTVSLGPDLQAMPGTIGDAGLTITFVRPNFAFGSGSAHNHGMDIRVKYVDLILAVKD